MGAADPAAKGAVFRRRILRSAEMIGNVPVEARTRLAWRGTAGAVEDFVAAVILVTIEPKYVNMTDVNIASLPDEATAARVGGSSALLTAPVSVADKPEIALIELLFYAYRDFVSDPDAVLVDYQFGRAHHRVLHFVDRHPGMPVADLLDILKITKQSLGRVLKELIDTGFIEQVPGPVDRRQRLLYPTQKGRALSARLTEPQARRIQAALAALDPAGRAGAERFLRLMIDAAERDKVSRLISR